MTINPAIRAMIVDDEEPARSELKYLLQQYPDVIIVCEAGCYQEAVTAINRCHPHLVFLDVDMPGMNGIFLAEKILENQDPLIVFATAHEEFAVKAFELNAVDYLLKPFSPLRIARCIDKVRNLLLAREPVKLRQEDDGSAGIEHCCRQKFAFEQNGKAQVINIKDIVAACSSDGQVTVFTTHKVYQVNITLQELQSRLNDEHFFRSHRGFLVNVEAIREIIPWFNGAYNLILEGLPNMEIPVSRQQVPKLKKLFSL
jgi:DNA-binding LytR/AlgR family response regulator